MDEVRAVTLKNHSQTSKYESMSMAAAAVRCGGRSCNDWRSLTRPQSDLETYLCQASTKHEEEVFEHIAGARHVFQFERHFIFFIY